MNTRNQHTVCNARNGTEPGTRNIGTEHGMIGKHHFSPLRLLLQLKTIPRDVSSSGEPLFACVEKKNSSTVTLVTYLQYVFFFLTLFFHLCFHVDKRSNWYDNRVIWTYKQEPCHLFTSVSLVPMSHNWYELRSNFVWLFCCVD